jgi:hypothetical protein
MFRNGHAGLLFILCLSHIKATYFLIVTLFCLKLIDFGVAIFSLAGFQVVANLR